MSEFGFNWKPEEVEGMLDQIIVNSDSIITAILEEAADVLLIILYARTPKKSGEYAESWTKGQVNGNSIKISSPKDDLFVLLEYTGSMPHTIEPRDAKALHFVTPQGEEVFTMRVDHKGFPPMPHLRPAMSEFAKAFPQIIFKHLSLNVKGFGKPITVLKY